MSGPGHLRISTWALSDSSVRRKCAFSIVHDIPPSPSNITVNCVFLKERLWLTVIKRHHISSHLCFEEGHLTHSSPHSPNPQRNVFKIIYLKIIWVIWHTCVLVCVWISGLVVWSSVFIWGDLLNRACQYPVAVYTHVRTSMCVCGDVAPGLLWSSPCLISMSIDSICFAHERARMCRRTGERKNEGCGGGPGTAVYLSPPCRNLYRTLSALIKDHSVGFSLSPLAFSPLCSLSLPLPSLPCALFLFLTHTHIFRYTHKWKDWHICKYTSRTLPFIFMLTVVCAIYTWMLYHSVCWEISRCAPLLVAKYRKKH